VTFVLHESFQNPKRDHVSPPYELTEVGWGEFDIVVTVHFHVSAEEEGHEGGGVAARAPPC
jgi:YEATS domain-containing protein 4